MTPGEMKPCIYCNKPVATQKDWDEIPGGEGEHLCWGECQERMDPEAVIRSLRERESALTALLERWEADRLVLETCGSDYVLGCHGELKKCITELRAVIQPGGETETEKEL